jgi:hypothetical protein
MAARRAQSRTGSPRRPNLPRGGVAQPLETVSKGACELVEDGKSLQLRIYCSFEDAVAQGISPKVAAVVFKGVGGAAAARCTGSCSKQTKGKLVWCRNANTCRSPCSCHLFAINRANGAEEDQGAIEREEDAARMVAGFVYVCRCV